MFLMASIDPYMCLPFVGLRGVQIECRKYPRIFCGILSVPQNDVYEYE